MFEALGIVIAAVVTALGAVWLDRSFQQQDRRRDLYLEILDYLDNVGVMIKEQLVADAAFNKTMNEIERRLNSMNAKVSLLASENVRERLRSYREAWPKSLGESSPAG